MGAFVTVVLVLNGAVCGYGWLLVARGYPPLLPVLLTVATVSAAIFFRTRILSVYRNGERVLDFFARGYASEELYHTPTHYSPGMARMIARFQSLLDNYDVLQAGKRQEQFLALQNQINPHFLYNTLEGIRSEALSAGLDSVAEMTEALSRFYRYTISNLDNLVTLEDELDSVQTYFLIQRFRFGKRLQLRTIFEDGDELTVVKHHTPKLILQPIVENAIIHGLESKVGNGTLTLRVESTDAQLVITVSDDGVGMDPQRLEEVNGLLAMRSGDRAAHPSQRGGIAIRNVNNRIKLLLANGTVSTLPASQTSAPM